MNLIDLFGAMTYSDAPNRARGFVSLVSLAYCNSTNYSWVLIIIFDQKKN
jgi:hypothetical protein